MMFSTGDDDALYDASNIHDLDHAPAPPEEISSGRGLFRVGGDPPPRSERSMSSRGGWGEGIQARRASLQETHQGSQPRGRVWSTDSTQQNRRASLQDFRYHSRSRMWSDGGLVGAGGGGVDSTRRRGSLQEGKIYVAQEASAAAQAVMSAISRNTFSLPEDESTSHNQHHESSSRNYDGVQYGYDDDEEEEWGGEGVHKGVTWDDDDNGNDEDHDVHEHTGDHSGTSRSSVPGDFDGGVVGDNYMMKSQSSSNSVWTDASQEEEDDDDDNNNDPTEYTDHSEAGGGRDMRESRKWAACLMWLFPCCPRPPTMNRVALAVALYAPCFCCMGFKQRTDRALLGRLNVLVAFAALVQVALGLFLITVLLIGSERTTLIEQNALYSFFSPLFWNINGSMFLVCLACVALFIAATVTWRVVRDVNLVGAVRYYWTLMWLSPFVLFCVVALFDIFGAANVYVKHWWRSFQLSWFRHAFCEEGTENTCCVVPIADNETETAWCLSECNATNCTKIRDEAQQATSESLSLLYRFSGVWALLLLFLLLLASDTLQRMITRPIVQRSKQYNVPAWLALPTIICTSLGVFFTFGKLSSLNAGSADISVKWIGPAFIAVGGMSFIGILLGSYASSASILNTNDKRRKLAAVTVFTGSMAGTLLLLIALFISCIYFSIAAGHVPITEQQRGSLACMYDPFDGCTNCTNYDAEADRCPQWSEQDVRAVLQTQIKASATVAAVFILHILNVLNYAMTLRRHTSTYQIAFV